MSRVDGSCSAPTHLHWHNGRTCHGAPSLQACADEAIANQWIGKILEVEDVYQPEGTPVKCYSMITFNFDSWARFGRFVAEIVPTLVLQVAADHDPVRDSVGHQDT